MNLQEMLSVRKMCLIHNLPMVPEAFIAPARMEITDKGIRLLAKDRFEYNQKGKMVVANICILRFSFNGTYILASERPRWMTESLENFQIYMICSECAKLPINRGEGLGQTPLENLRNNQHYYTFQIHREQQGKYLVVPGVEEIKYCTSDMFYHLGIDLQDKHAAGRIGSCEKDQKLGSILNSLITLNIPQFNIERIQTLDQYLDKMKLYCIMS